MSLVTYFRATLACAHGEHLGTAWIPSKLGHRGATYSVGDAFGDEIVVVDEDDCVFRVRAPAPDEPVHVLGSYTCEVCGLESFAEIVLDGGCVRSIDVVDLDPQTLERLHYIDAGLYDMLETIIGEPVHQAGQPGADWLRLLREALHAGRGWGTQHG